MTPFAILQVAEVLEQGEKWSWLQSRLSKFIDDGDVLVFASTQARVDELTAQLQGADIKYASLLHLDDAQLQIIEYAHITFAAFSAIV